MNATLNFTMGSLGEAIVKLSSLSLPVERNSDTPTFREVVAGFQTLRDWEKSILGREHEDSNKVGDITSLGTNDNHQ